MSTYTPPAAAPPASSSELTLDLTPTTSACCVPGVALPLSGEEADQCAAMLKALAHPVRLQMVALLHQAQGQLCVCELEAHFALAQPTISHHLKVLRQAGLITGEGRGVWIYYAIRPEAMTQLGTLLHSLGAQAGQA